MYAIAWLNARPYCWAASLDGITFVKLKADNDEDSSEAVDEASEKFGIPTNKWQVLDDPINNLIDSK